MFASFAFMFAAAFRASAAVAAEKLLNSDCSTLANCNSSGQGATHNPCLEKKNVGEVLGNEECPPNMCVEKKNEGNKTARKLCFSLRMTRLKKTVLVLLV